MSRKSPGTFAISIFILILFGISGCNTVKGAGQDIKAAGGAIEKKAKGATTY